MAGAAQYSPSFWQDAIDALTVAASAGITTAGTTCVQALVLFATERDGN